MAPCAGGAQNATGVPSFVFTYHLKPAIDVSDGLDHNRSLNRELIALLISG
ncbi:hypothetical protein CEV32_3914 [Brucella rhizosphaerae]|uniref:Uncharacterized protein n=1 Tax=Brucella rhizosphaerae TaxID=571254 RepID=A0A256FRF9_9HYPH|nr:hypothetical protein CEV32_3914 [Brucella rhizosphaerae]